MADTYTREDWARALLQALGNSNPTRDDVNFVINWTTQEDNQTQPGFNLLNTTQPLNGSTGTGTQGNIQVYRSFADGIQATAQTIENGNYPILWADLKDNNTQDLFAGSSEVQKEMGVWGTGWKSWYSQTPSPTILAQQEPGTMTNLAQPGSVVGNVVDAVQNTTQIFANIASAWQVLQSPGTWIAVGLFVAALAALIIGVIVFDTAPTHK